MHLKRLLLMFKFGMYDACVRFSRMAASAMDGKARTVRQPRQHVLMLHS